MSAASPHVDSFIEVDETELRVYAVSQSGEPSACEIHVVLDARTRLPLSYHLAQAGDRQLVIDVLLEQCDANGCCDGELIAWGAGALGCSERWIRRWLERGLRASSPPERGDLR